MEHSFDIEHAKKYSVDVAIVLKNLQFWIMKNKANNRHFYEGRTWTYNSVKAFAELFPYWTERQLIRILKTMEEKKIIISGNYNKSAYDRTKWYAFFDESIYLKSEIHFTERSNGNTEKVKPIPDNKPDENNTDNKQHIQVLGFEQKKNLKEDKFKENSIVSQAKRPNTPCIENILSYLNKKTGSNYQTRNQTVKKLIEKHIKAGYTEEDFLTVIEKKSLEWGKDEKMKKFIRPVTLFGNKFEQYLEEPWADQAPKNQATYSAPDYWAKKEAPEGHLYNRAGELVKIQEEATQEEKEQARKEREIFEKEAEKNREIEKQKELEKK
ncbi:MAG: conserved phage C-terminal domain-containing protein [Acutalibacteraceae bacterium]